MMNGIDISRYQTGINLSVVPCDFVIVKATQGTTYVSPAFKQQIEQAKSCGKLLGVYHYSNGSGADAEAEHFVNVIDPYIGNVILAIDWENNKSNGRNDNPKFVAGDYKYCEQLLAAVRAKTGITPFLYMSKSVARQFPWTEGKNYPLWCAQYKLIPPKTYVDNPWTDSKGFGAWKDCKILQYSSKGRLNGYDANLDLDKAYFNREQWLNYANGDMDSAVEPLKPISTSALPVLKMGSTGAEVMAWQNYLNQHGFDCGLADGIFGKRTKNAVIAYQKVHPECGKPDGIIGAKTWKSIGLS